MTIRLQDPPLNNTTSLLAHVLTHALKGEYVLFLCPAGEGRAITNRLRMQLSRQRKKLRERGKRFQQFTLHSTIHPETHDGIRYDAIVMWKQQSLSQIAAQDIENLLADGATA